MPRRWMPLAAAAFLLLLVGLAATTGSLPLRTAPLGAPKPAATWDPGLPTAHPQVQESVGAAAQRIVIPSILVYAVQAFCLLLVLGIVGVLVYFLIRGAVRRVKEMPPPPPVGSARVDSAKEIQKAVDQGLVELDDSDADPRKVVIACWVRLERAADLAGMPRKPGDTPTELVLRLLADRAVDGTVLNDFADVYRAARYSPHVVDVTMRDRARGALRVLRDALTVERAEVAQ
ncbi:DUF4129 domain-containing protein [Hamadaea tsunoensis]|uniref:DUF4129 domain-containing protein n=1 Tax=Hamadaea tsunoensis TaxID=53368 RepID=UPI0003F7F36D|nr:DUF4129 domain-containing protein [Hamadaea tsunoensis]